MIWRVRHLQNNHATVRAESEIDPLDYTVYHNFILIILIRKTIVLYLSVPDVKVQNRCTLQYFTIFLWC